MIKYKIETRDVSTAVATICDVCGAESISLNTWGKVGTQITMTIYRLLSSWSGESSDKQMDLCPVCFGKVEDLLLSLGGKWQEM